MKSAATGPGLFLRCARAASAALVLSLAAACGGNDDSLAANDQQFTVDEDTLLGPAVLDVRGTALQFTLVTPPVLGRVDFYPENGRASFTYFPERGRHGTDTIVYRVTDSGGNALERTLSIRIQSINDVAFISIAGGNAPREVNEDTALEIPLRMTDEDGDAELIVVSPPAHGTVSPYDAERRSVTYQPRADFAGPDSITFAVRDPSATYASVTQPIRVMPVNDPPVVRISAPAGPLPSGTLVDLTCSATDVDSAPPTRFRWSGAFTEDIGFASATQLQFLTPSQVAGTTLQINCSTAPDIWEAAGTYVDLIIAPAPDFDGDATADFSDPDDDGDGYADFVESLLGSNPWSGASRPLGRDAASLGIDYRADHDGDRFATWHEALSRRDPSNRLSVPSDLDRDGIPDLVDRNGFPDETAPMGIAAAGAASVIDVTSGTAPAGLDMTVVDLTGLQRVWAYLELDEPVANPRRLVFDSTAPLSGVLDAQRLQTLNISPHAPRGTWRLGAAWSRDTSWNTSQTSFHISNRAMRIDYELVGQGMVDDAPPVVTAFSVLSNGVDAAAGGQKLAFRLAASDSMSAIAGIELDFGTFYGRMWMRSSAPAASGIFEFFSDDLPATFAATTRNIVTLTVYDTAGNPVQLNRAALLAAGFDSQVITTNSRQ